MTPNSETPHEVLITPLETSPLPSDQNPMVGNRVIDEMENPSSEDDLLKVQSTEAGNAITFNDETPMVPDT
jgi:hypothetical protein